MKRSLVAIAALAAASAASAQSSVTLFGVADAAISSYSNKTESLRGVGITTSQTGVSPSGYNSGRLGFRGTEDLGGGLAASFWLEAGLNVDTGTGAGTAGAFNYNRRSTVSLSGAFGEIRMGRDYTPTFWNDTVFDPFGSNGVGASILLTANGYSSSGAITNGFTSNGNYARASNSIGFFLPRDLGGFYGQAMFAMNEKTSYDPGSLTPPGSVAIVGNPALAVAAYNARAGRYWGVRGGYASGALDIAAAYAQSTVASNYFLGTTTNLDIWNLGASYDFGVVKLFGEYSNNKQDTKRTFTLANFQKPGANGWLLGATVPVGPGLIRLAYSEVNYNNVTRLNQVFGLTDDPKADKWALGYVHNLSRRTALYATVASIRNKNGADLILGGPNFYQATSATGVLIPKSSTGYDFGIRHIF